MNFENFIQVELKAPKQGHRKTPACGHRNVCCGKDTFPRVQRKKRRRSGATLSIFPLCAFSDLRDYLYASVLAAKKVKKEESIEINISEEFTEAKRIIKIFNMSNTHQIKIH